MHSSQFHREFVQFMQDQEIEQTCPKCGKELRTEIEAGVREVSPSIVVGVECYDVVHGKCDFRNFSSLSMGW